MGMRQSFIRKPGTEQVLVRIGIGRDGVFKVDGMENKVGQMDDPFVDGWAVFKIVNIVYHTECMH